LHRLRTGGCGDVSRRDRQRSHPRAGTNRRLTLHTSLSAAARTNETAAPAAAPTRPHASNNDRAQQLFGNRAVARTLQRSCACGGGAGSSSCECDEKKESESGGGELHRFANGSAPAVAPPIVGTA